MKLIATPTLLLAAVAHGATEPNTPPPEGQTQNPMAMLRAANTNNPELADFPEATQFDIDALGSDFQWTRGSSSSKCFYVKVTNSNGAIEDVYERDCTYSIYGSGSGETGAHGVPCEWRGAAGGQPDAAGSYNGWHCDADGTACFSVIQTSPNDWWDALTKCEAAFGADIHLAAPQSQAEVELITKNYWPNGYSTRMYYAGFWDEAANSYFWTHGGTPVPAAATGPQTFTPTPGSAQEMLTDFVEHVFDSYALVSYSLSAAAGTNGRKKRSAIDVIDAVTDYGCWCSVPFTGEGNRGKALDDLDKICVSYAQCAKCERFSSCSGNATTDGFTAVYDPSDDSYTCTSSSDCGKDSCECMASFALDLARYLADLPSIEFDSDNYQVADTSCEITKSTSGSGSGNGIVDSCCGEAPVWTPYSSNSYTCSNGALTLIPKSQCSNGNVCHCFNGQADDCTDHTCNVNGAQECQSCNPGYQLDSTAEWCNPI